MEPSRRPYGSRDSTAKSQETMDSCILGHSGELSGNLDTNRKRKKKLGLTDFLLGQCVPGTISPDVPVDGIDRQTAKHTTMFCPLLVQGIRKLLQRTGRDSDYDELRIRPDKTGLTRLVFGGGGATLSSIEKRRALAAETHRGHRGKGQHALRA